MSARCVSLALCLIVLFSSWMNQDPFLVFLIAAVPETQTTRKTQNVSNLQSLWHMTWWMVRKSDEDTTMCTHWNLWGWQSRRSCQISGAVWLSVSPCLSPPSLCHLSPPLCQHPSVHSLEIESVPDHPTGPRRCPSPLKQKEMFGCLCVSFIFHCLFKIQ